MRTSKGVFVTLCLFLFLLDSLDIGANKISPSEGSPVIDSILKIHSEDFAKFRYSKPDSALAILYNALVDPAFSNSKKAKSSLYTYMAEHYLYQQQLDSSLHYADKVLDMSGEEKKDLEFRVVTVKGTVEFYRGNYEKAIDHHLQGLAIVEAEGNILGQARAFNNIGIVYIKLQDWVKAEEYMTRSLTICNTLGRKDGMSYALGNLAIIYRNQGKLDRAIDMYQRSISINLEEENRVSLAKNYGNISTLFESTNNLDSAILYCKRGLSIAEEDHLTTEMQTGFHNLGNLYTKLGQFKQAESNLDKAHVIARDTRSKDTQMNIALAQANLYKAMGNYKKAFKAQKEYSTWKDSLESADKIKAINELNIKYDTEKRQRENLLLTNQNLSQQNLIQSQQNRNRVLLFVFSGISLLFIGAILIYRQKEMTTRQRDLLLATNHSQLVERKRLAQDLHDSLGGTIAMLKNRLSSLLPRTLQANQAELEEVIDQVSKAGEELRNISHDLMPPELEKFGLVSAIEATIEYLESSNLAVNLYVDNYNAHMALQRELQIVHIVKELVQNVIKHAEAKTLSIHLTSHKAFLNLLVEDDGVGWDKDKDHGMGLGLNNVQTRVTLLQGSVQLDTGKGSGTTINITCPYE